LVEQSGSVTASDALTLLRAAIGELRCHDYVCDLTADGNTTSSDALAALATSVGSPAPRDCPIEDAPTDQSNDRITITNNAATLAGRVTLMDADVPVNPTSSSFSLPGVTLGGVQSGFSLTLIAEVAPPQVDGQILQATAIHRAQSANHFLVSYNVRGEPRMGAIEYFDVHKPAAPELTSQVLFSDTDVSAAFDHNFVAYLAEATDAPGFPAPAALEAIEFKQGKFMLENSFRLPLTSYAATHVTVSGDVVYVASGADGAVTGFDHRTSHEQIFSVELDDLRWIEAHSGYIIAVQGTPGRITTIDTSTFEVISTWPFTGADIPESKSTVTVKGGKAFIAAGTGGVQVLSVRTGQLLGQIPAPIVDGLDPSETVTNAVAVHGSLAFVSNGEAGVYVARMPGDATNTPDDEPLSFDVLGKLEFGVDESVNHVEFHGHYLILASGLGGLKIVRVSNQGPS
jgi:hypothetical protein